MRPEPRLPNPGIPAERSGPVGGRQHAAPVTPRPWRFAALVLGVLVGACAATLYLLWQGVAR